MSKRQGEEVTEAKDTKRVKKTPVPSAPNWSSDSDEESFLNAITPNEEDKKESVDLAIVKVEKTDDDCYGWITVSIGRASSVFKEDVINWIKKNEGECFVSTHQSNSEKAVELVQTETCQSEEWLPRHCKFATRLYQFSCFMPRLYVALQELFDSDCSVKTYADFLQILDLKDKGIVRKSLIKSYLLEIQDVINRDDVMIPFYVYDDKSELCKFKKYASL